MPHKSEARFIAQSDAGVRVCAAAARLSTQEGTALQIFDRSRGDERDLNLIRKVLSSGHKSLMEHHIFSLAMENVSVLVEQFLIEFRLSSFMVKSRRYVNFQDAGFYVPEKLDAGMRAAYEENMRALFSDYGQLLSLGIPKEDARFVLPYCFFSNLYMTLNARELVHLICSMCYGRGSDFAEIRALGEQLQAQFAQVFPRVIEGESERYMCCADRPLSTQFAAPHVVKPEIVLLQCPNDAENLLRSALAFTGRFAEAPLSTVMAQLRTDARPRELECLNYSFLVSDVSLPSVTHYVRHRIQSPLIEQPIRALNKGGYILPASIANDEQAARVYAQCFERNYRAVDALLHMGMQPQDAAYFTLSGGTIDLMITMNARELLQFLKLRTCTRAQWEIRDLSARLLDQLRAHSPAIFSHFGPSCAVNGRCPEGRMSCGEPQKLPGSAQH